MKKKVSVLLSISAISLATFALALPATKGYIQVRAGEIGDYGDDIRMPSMSFFGDTTSKMGFCWTTTNFTKTNLQVLEKSVYDASTGFGDPTVASQIKYFDGTTEGSPISGDGFIHKVNAFGLTPDTQYAYRFGDEDINRWCEVGTFKTSAKTNRNFSFLHISDPQGDNELHYESYNQLLNDMKKNVNPEWVALTGDITDDSHFGGSIDLHEWELALTNQWEIFKDLPVAAVSGNHDGAINAFHSRYNNDIVAGSDYSTGDYYSFDYQGVHFTCINSNDTPNPKDPDTTGLREPQLEWVKQDLAAHKDDKFLIVMMHKGLFDSGGHSCNDDKGDYDIEQMRRQLTPLFTQYGVDLVLEGHDHLYNLSYPMVAETYVGQENYYHIDEDYKYSLRDYEEFGLQDVYTFSNLKGTFFFNTGTATGQKYYAPVIGGSMEKTIFDTVNPNQKMFTMVDVLDNTILLRTYLCTSNETSLFKTYAIAKDSEGTPAQEHSEYDTDFEVEGTYSFNYKFSRYNHVAKVSLRSQKLVAADADLAAKFTGSFTCDGGNGTSLCRLYRNGKVKIDTELVIENETIFFNTTGEWHMDDNKRLIITVKDEKDANETYYAKISGEKKDNTLVIVLSITIPVVVIGIGVGVFFFLKNKKKAKKEA